MSDSTEKPEMFTTNELLSGNANFIKKVGEDGKIYYESPVFNFCSDFPKTTERWVEIVSDEKKEFEITISDKKYVAYRYNSGDLNISGPITLKEIKEHFKDGSIEKAIYVSNNGLVDYYYYEDNEWQVEYD